MTTHLRVRQLSLPVPCRAGGVKATRVGAFPASIHHSHMKFEIPHNLGKAEARRRIEAGMPKLAAHISFSCGRSAKACGQLGDSLFGAGEIQG
jgi:hypothetical protein